MMAHLWGALATRDVRPLKASIEALGPRPEESSWVYYLRCHDDIGWAICDDELLPFGFAGAAHRGFLADYYSGSFPGSHARGDEFQRRGDECRTVGTTRASPASAPRSRAASRSLSTAPSKGS